MGRPKFPFLAFSIFSFTLVLLIGLATPDQAFAAPTLSVTPSSLSFTGVPVGSTSGSQQVSATAVGGLISFPPGHNDIVVTSPFVITSNNCGTSLAKGKTCMVDVACQPENSGTFSGTLTFNTAPASATQTVSLSCSTSGATATPTATATATATPTATATST